MVDSSKKDEVGVLGVLKILEEIKQKQDENEGRMVAQWLSTVGLGLIAVVLGAMAVWEKPLSVGMTVFAFCFGLLLILAPTFRYWIRRVRRPSGANKQHLINH